MSILILCATVILNTCFGIPLDQIQHAENLKIVATKNDVPEEFSAEIAKTSAQKLFESATVKDKFIASELIDLSSKQTDGPDRTNECLQYADYNIHASGMNAVTGDVLALNAFDSTYHDCNLLHINGNLFKYPDFASARYRPVHILQDNQEFFSSYIAVQESVMRDVDTSMNLEVGGEVHGIPLYPMTTLDASFKLSFGYSMSAELGWARSEARERSSSFSMLRRKTTLVDYGIYTSSSAPHSDLILKFNDLPTDIGDATGKNLVARFRQAYGTHAVIRASLGGELTFISLLNRDAMQLSASQQTRLKNCIQAGVQANASVETAFGLGPGGSAYLSADASACSETATSGGEQVNLEQFQGEAKTFSRGGKSIADWEDTLEQYSEPMATEIESWSVVLSNNAHMKEQHGDNLNDRVKVLQHWTNQYYSEHQATCALYDCPLPTEYLNTESHTFTEENCCNPIEFHYTKTTGACRGGANYPGEPDLWKCVHRGENAVPISSLADCTVQCNNDPNCHSFDQKLDFSTCCLFGPNNHGDGQSSHSCYEGEE